MYCLIFNMARDIFFFTVNLQRLYLNLTLYTRVEVIHDKKKTNKLQHNTNDSSNSSQS